MSKVLCHIKDMFMGQMYVCHSSHLFVCPLSIQGKRLPAYLSADAEEGEVSDDDSADEIEDDFKLKSSNVRSRNVAINMHEVSTPKQTHVTVMCGCAHLGKLSLCLHEISLICDSF